MSRDVSPILDRHTQDRLGRMLRERLDEAQTANAPNEIDALLAALRAADAPTTRAERR